jgi:hypothetical protein
MKHLRWWPALGSVVLMGAVLAGCGGNGDSSGTGSLRLINATRTHASLDLYQSSTLAASGTQMDTISGYVGVPVGSPTLQLNDAGGSTALLATATTIVSGQHYTLLAYESAGSLKTAVLTEDFAAPASGTGQLRIYDTAIETGAIDVYITDPSTDLSTLSTPTAAFSAQTYAQSSGLMAYAPGTYRVRVTASGNKSQLLLDMPAVTISDQQILTIALTPSAGGILLDGSMLSQQGAYTAARNTTARVRLVAAVSGGVPVAASAGSNVIDSFTAAPAVGTYAIVPVSGALNISVNGNSVGAPASTLTAGNDYTLLVYGSSTSATPSLITDDNHLPTLTTNTKLRLINGLTGTATGLTLEADFAAVASNVLPAVASAYGTVPGNSAMELDVTSALSSTAIYSRSDLNIAGSSIYTLFMVGDSSTPQGVLRRDR